MHKQDITRDQFQEILDYNPETGEFTWKINRGKNKSVKAGDAAGCLRNGYRSIGSFGNEYMAHRIAFLMMTGEWPIGHMDHINRIRDDNRWCNLRHAINKDADNNQNRTINKNSTSGFPCVAYRKGKYRVKPWIAYIGHKGKRTTIGYFHTPEEAHKAYLNKKAELHTFSPVVL